MRRVIYFSICYILVSASLLLVIMRFAGWVTQERMEVSVYLKGNEFEITNCAARDLGQVVICYETGRQKAYKVQVWNLRENETRYIRATDLSEGDCCIKAIYYNGAHDTQKEDS